MTATRKANAQASRAARVAVAYLGEEERWALLQRWIEKEPAGQRKVGRRSPRLEALRSIVCPCVNDLEWGKVVQENRPVRWADELRVANALASRRPEPVTPGNTQGAPAGSGRSIPQAQLTTV